MRIRDINAAINCVQKAITKIEKLNKLYPQRYKEELEEVGNSVIDQWYETYDPIVYERTGSLYNAFKVTLNGTDYNVSFDSSFIGNKIIFYNSFMEGYHGGAKSGKTKFGEPHPAPGIPYWKTPIPEFTHWGRPAMRSFSPYTRMMSEMKKRIKQIDKEKQDEFDSIMAKVRRAVEKIY